MFGGPHCLLFVEVSRSETLLETGDEYSQYSYVEDGRSVCVKKSEQAEQELVVRCLCEVRLHRLGSTFSRRCFAGIIICALLTNVVIWISLEGVQQGCIGGEPKPYRYRPARRRKRRVLGRHAGAARRPTILHLCSVRANHTLERGRRRRALQGLRHRRGDSFFVCGSVNEVRRFVSSSDECIYSITLVERTL